MKRAGWAVLAGLALTAAPVRGQIVQAGDLELDLTGRLQIQFQTTSVTADDVGPGAAPPATAFETRRIQFGTSFAYGDWLTGKLQADFRGASTALTDGYIDAMVSDAVGVRMGQFKKPFGLFDRESDTKIETIERAVRIGGLTALVPVPGEAEYLVENGGYSGRQIGVMLHGSVWGVGYQVGVFNGEGANARETMESKAVAVRGAYEVGGTLVGVAMSRQPSGVLTANGEEILTTAFAVEAEYGEFRSEGLHVMAEAMYGGNPLLIAGDEAPTMVGAQAVAAWFMPRDGRVEGWEPVLRLSWADPDTAANDNEGLLLTPGVNLYFSGRNRLMLNADAYLPAQSGLDPELGVIAQFQIYF